jgi:crotonobetaine/carnitine-CoA ligase
MNATVQHDPGTDLRFPSRDESVVADLLAGRAASTPDKPFLLFEDEQWTYAQAAREAWRAANGLRRLGVGMRDYVSVWVPTGPDVLRAWFGANAAGAVYAPLNLASRGTYLEHTLNLAEAKVLVAHRQLLDRLAGLDLPHLETVVVVGGTPEAELPWQTLTMEELLDDAGDERPSLPRPVEPWDDLSLIYTSGTTGPSKGVRAAYAAFWNYANCFNLPFVTEDDRNLSSLPMFHTAGTGLTYSMLRAGGSVALNKGFSASRFWDDVRRFEATVTIAIHGMVTFMLDQPEKPDDADNPLRVVYMGPLSNHQEFARRYGVSIYTAYGMTEVPVPIVSELDPEDARSCGRAADPVHYELRLVDEHDIPVPPGTPGELVARHTLPWTINSGYKNMPEATAEAWRNGWFHTGDQFTQDEAGNFYFLDRIKDVIRRRGENISSFEVEAEVLSHPLVKDAAAVAVKNPDLDEAAGDEEVKVAVVLEEGAVLDPAELVEYLAARMPAYWVPRFIEYVEELPRTESHKLKKAELRDVGITPGTWDRERAGVKLKREVLR